MSRSPTFPSSRQNSPASGKWWGRYIGIPFDWTGSSIEGASCWGLVCLVHKYEFGNNLPRFEDCDLSVRDGKPVTVDKYATLGTRVNLQDVQTGDVLQLRGLYKGRMLPLHCGIVTEPGHMLHTREGLGAHVVSYTTRQWHNMILGAYRCITSQSK